jgi:hypothetical protein
MIARKDAVTLASRTLATLLTVWALADVSYLPERAHSFLHYLNHEPASSTAIELRSPLLSHPTGVPCDQGRRFVTYGEVAL